MKPTNEAPIHLTRKRHSIPCKRDVISSEWSNLKRFKKFKFLLHRIVSGRGWWGSLGRFKLWWPRIRWRHITATTSSVHLVGLDEYETLKRIETNKKNIPSKKEIQTLTGGLWWTALIKSLLSSHETLRVMRSTSSTESHFRPLSCCCNIRRRLSSSWRTPPVSFRPFTSTVGFSLPDGLDVAWWAMVTNSNLALISELILSLPILPGEAFTSLSWRTGLTLRSRPLNIDRGLDESWISSSGLRSSDSMSKESHSTPS